MNHLSLRDRALHAGGRAGGVRERGLSGENCLLQHAGRRVRPVEACKRPAQPPLTLQIAVCRGLRQRFENELPYLVGPARGLEKIVSDFGGDDLRHILVLTDHLDLVLSEIGHIHAFLQRQHDSTRPRTDSGRKAASLRALALFQCKRAAEPRISDPWTAISARCVPLCRAGTYVVQCGKGIHCNGASPLRGTSSPRSAAARARPAVRRANRCALDSLRGQGELNPMSAKKSSLSQEALEPLIFSIRGRRVMLDADLARLYRVTTKVLNQTVKRNSSRFPQDFAFQLALADVAGLRAQTATSSLHASDLKKDIGNQSQFVTGSQKHRDPRIRPWAFTEHGALMAANILRSDRAVQMSVFVRLREHIAANAAILKRLAEIDKTLLQHDAVLRDIYDKLLPLLQPPPTPPKRRIGFLADDE